jgi:hypothetical protein
MTETENFTNELLINFIPNLLEFQNEPMKLTEGISNALRRDFLPMGYNLLSHFAYTNNLTKLGNYRKIEFRLDLINLDYPIWIDVKHLFKSSSISDICFGDILRAKTLNGVLWLVFYGEGYDKFAINELNSLLHNKVKFIMGAEHLKSELIKYF